MLEVNGKSQLEESRLEKNLRVKGESRLLKRKSISKRRNSIRK